MQGDQRYDYSTIYGIGEWTCKCARIMLGDFSVGFIVHDLAVRKELERQLNINGISPQYLSKLLKASNLTTIDKGELFSILWNMTRK